MGSRGASSGINKASPVFPGVEIGSHIHIQDWFTYDNPSYAIRTNRGQIVGESASGKAWKVGIETETADGERDVYIERWMPKKAVISKEQHDYELQQREKKWEKSFKKGEKKYAKMIEFAKKNNVKGVRVGLRKETILEKIKKAGLNYKY